MRGIMTNHVKKESKYDEGRKGNERCKERNREPRRKEWITGGKGDKEFRKNQRKEESKDNEGMKGNERWKEWKREQGRKELRNGGKGAKEIRKNQRKEENKEREVRAGGMKERNKWEKNKLRSRSKKKSTK